MTEFLQNWASQAECRDDPDRMFVTGAEQNAAKRICGSCIVKTACLAEALDNRIEFGVWGGMTERQRRALLRQHPEVPSWDRVLHAAARKAAGEAPVHNQDGRAGGVAGAAGAAAIGIEAPGPAHGMPDSRAAALPDVLPGEGS